MCSRRVSKGSVSASPTRDAGSKARTLSSNFWGWAFTVSSSGTGPLSTRSPNSSMSGSVRGWRSSGSTDRAAWRAVVRAALSSEGSMAARASSMDSRPETTPSVMGAKERASISFRTVSRASRTVPTAVSAADSTPWISPIISSRAVTRAAGSNWSTWPSISPMMAETASRTGPKRSVILPVTWVSKSAMAVSTPAVMAAVSKPSRRASSSPKIDRTWIVTWVNPPSSPSTPSWTVSATDSMGSWIPPISRAVSRASSQSRSGWNPAPIAAAMSGSGRAGGMAPANAPMSGLGRRTDTRWPISSDRSSPRVSRRLLRPARSAIGSPAMADLSAS